MVPKLKFSNLSKFVNFVNSLGILISLIFRIVPPCGVAYDTNNLGNQYDLRRFDDILKAKKNRSRYAEDPSSTYGRVA
jgi:hypothetical protein